MQSGFPLIPESASTLSSQVDALYFYISGVTVFFTLLISVVILFFVVKYRRRDPSEIPRPIEGSMKLETLWSVIPLLIAMTIFFWGAKVYFVQYRPPKNAEDIYFVCKKWIGKFLPCTAQRVIKEMDIACRRNITL